MNYQPLSPTRTERHVLLIDARASLHDLHAYGSERLQAGTDMIESLSCLNLNKVDDEDVAHFIQGAALLLRDGHDIWKVIEMRTLEAERRAPSAMQPACPQARFVETITG